MYTIQLCKVLNFTSKKNKMFHSPAKTGTMLQTKIWHLPPEFGSIDTVLYEALGIWAPILLDRETVAAKCVVEGEWVVCYVCYTRLAWLLCASGRMGL